MNRVGEHFGRVQEGVFHTVSCNIYHRQVKEMLLTGHVYSQLTRFIPLAESYIVTYRCLMTHMPWFVPYKHAVFYQSSHSVSEGTEVYR